LLLLMAICLRAKVIVQSSFDFEINALKGRRVGDEIR